MKRFLLPASALVLVVTAGGAGASRRRGWRMASAAVTPTGDLIR